MSYSFIRIDCPTVSDYKTYGELHILRCSLEGLIQTPNYCEPVTVECGEYKFKKSLFSLLLFLLMIIFVNIIIDSEELIHNPYNGQVFIETEKTNGLSHGPLAVFLDGSKLKFVCYNSNFTKYVADSACRQLGYTGSSSHTSQVK